MIGERSNLAHLSVVATEQPSPWLHERMRPGVWGRGRGRGRVGEGGGGESTVRFLLNLHHPHITSNLTFPLPSATVRAYQP